MLKRLVTACVLGLATVAVPSSASPNGATCIPWLGCRECPFYICL